MTHRERFYSVVTHTEADRAVFDLFGSPQTRIDYQQTKDALLSLLGIEGPYQGDFEIDERVLVGFDIDTRRLGGLHVPKTAHCREENGVYYNSYGIGSRQVKGHHEMCFHPLAGKTIDEVLAFPMPDAELFDREAVKFWAARAKYFKENTDYAIVAEHPFFGIFEIGCWMFGFEDYLYRLAAEPETVHAFSKKFFDYQKRVIEIYYGELGPYIDCTTSGDDFGTQTGAFMSKKMFDEYIKPYLKERIAYTKKYTDAFFKHHTCGSVYDLIPSLIECGADILNPIQPGVYMMEPERLKKDFGQKISFWGGIDTQHLLPEGSAADVAAEVARMLKIMGREGYILAPAHCIQPDVPAENIAEIYRAAKRFYL
ncbi:MAG: methyltransferase [Defluviitaleaceae bacterium]|nr:methyltransferase [Defluviitaleaceae bacterium]